MPDLLHDVVPGTTILVIVLRDGDVVCPGVTPHGCHGVDLAAHPALVLDTVSHVIAVDPPSLGFCRGYGTALSSGSASFIILCSFRYLCRYWVTMTWLIISVGVDH